MCEKSLGRKMGRMEVVGMIDIGNRGLRVVEKCVEYFNAD